MLVSERVPYDIGGASLEPGIFPIVRWVRSRFSEPQKFSNSQGRHSVAIFVRQLDGCFLGVSSWWEINSKLLYPGIVHIFRLQSRWWCIFSGGSFFFKAEAEKKEAISWQVLFLPWESCNRKTGWGLEIEKNPEQKTESTPFFRRIPADS